MRFCTQLTTVCAYTELPSMIQQRLVVLSVCHLHHSIDPYRSYFCTIPFHPFAFRRNDRQQQKSRTNVISFFFVFFLSFGIAACARALHTQVFNVYVTCLRCLDTISYYLYLRLVTTTY